MAVAGIGTFDAGSFGFSVFSGEVQSLVSVGLLYLECLEV